MVHTAKLLWDRRPRRSPPGVVGLSKCFNGCSDFAPGGGTASSRGWRSHRDRNPRIATSYDLPRMGRKNINAPMEGLCRCKPCGRFGPRDSCAPPGLDHRSGFLGVLVATLPPPQATRLARSAGRIMRLNRSALRIHKTSKISNKEFFSSPKNVYPTLRVSRIGGKCNALQQRPAGAGGFPTPGFH